MQIQCFTVGMFQVNTYLAQDAETGACAIVDTGESNELALRLAALDPRPDVQAILITHAHIDHAGGLMDIQAAFDAPTYLPALEKPFLDTLAQQGGWFGVPEMNRFSGRIDHEVQEGDLIRVGNMEFKFLSTPGHSPGQGCYYTDTDILVGDTLFSGSIGRTDLPGSNPAQMKESLRRLLELPGHLRVLSGHGPDTTLEQELKSNPFLGFIRQEKGLPTGYSYPW
uniref:Glyoxylase, beta-lactamase superfamily II n=1 Tax=Candidatus Kentrum sp. LPFa TaxID=2126335 RepID=A0A450W9I4_9GAMM|nr:MAG: Glyoxylase, beta-lactamase superfamily II [Candidatus Kentron sp. LPFa]